MPIDPEDLLARLQLHDSDLADLDVSFDTKHEYETSSEYVICKEDIFDILREAETEGKGGIEGCLSLWICEMASCGAVYCLDCVLKWMIERSDGTCPSCTRSWDTTAIQSQKDSYDEMRFEWHESSA
ncbi:hypothetical protein I302_104386 [Kwoniella bestiolae CBS 10118]|uniref:RING-type domain-containing protein n=1 Tax=Kwoniella bestiolae CBS 10118 TaxID=1296100 RepID=A0AAJ8M9B3_9TREE